MLSAIVAKFLKPALPYLQSAVSYLDASQVYGKRPDFDYRLAVKNYASWVYVAANLNAYAVASNPLRLYVEDRGVSKRFNTRKVPRGTRKYLTGATPNGPSNGVIAKADGMRDGFVEVVGQHPLLDLLKRANDYEDGFQQAALRIIYGELTGNAYLHPVIGASGVPEELWTMPAHWVEILPSRTEFIKGYRFGSSEELKTIFEPDEVIHFKRPNPRDLYYGMGKVAGGWWIIEQNRMIHEYDDATYRNMARPDFLLSVKGAAGKTQLDRFESMVENKLRGTRKAGQFIAMTGEVDLKPLSFPPKDLAGREDVVEEIAATFGVPVSMMKANDPNLASAKVGYAHWRSATILPLCRMDEETLNARLLPLFDLDPDRAFLSYDNPVPADEAAQVAQVSAFISAGVLTRNEARAEIGYEEVEGGDVLLVPSGFVPIDHAIKPPQPPPDPFGIGRMPPDGDSGNPRSGGDDPRGRGGDAAREDSTGEAEELPAEPAGDDDQPRKRARLSGAGAPHRRGGGHAGCGCQHAKRVSDLWEKAFTSPADEYRDKDLAKMEALLARQADAVGRLLADVGGAVTIAQVQEILMQPAFVAELGAALDSLIGEAIRSGATAGAAKLPESIQFDTFTNERVIEAARARTAKLAESLGRRTAERVASSVAQGLKDGRTIDDIAGGIRQAVGDPARAVNIARTETARAYSAGEEAAWRESGVVVGKQWLLAPDPCFTAGTLVMAMRNGKSVPVGIETIKAGDYVVAESGTPRRVSQVRSHVHTGDVVLGLGFIATPEHRFRTSSGWREIGEYAGPAPFDVLEDVLVSETKDCPTALRKVVSLAFVLGGDGGAIVPVQAIAQNDHAPVWDTEVDDPSSVHGDLLAVGSADGAKKIGHRLLDVGSSASASVQVGDVAGTATEVVGVTGFRGDAAWVLSKGLPAVTANAGDLGLPLGMGVAAHADGMGCVGAGAGAERLVSSTFGAMLGPEDVLAPIARLVDERRSVGKGPLGDAHAGSATELLASGNVPRKHLDRLRADFALNEHEHIVTHLVRIPSVVAEVFDIEVEVEHSFTLACGLVAHNCEFCEAAAEFDQNSKGRPLGQPFYRQGHTLTGADGGTMKLDFDDVDGPPLHPSCRCTMVPILESDE